MHGSRNRLHRNEQEILLRIIGTLHALLLICSSSGGHQLAPDLPAGYRGLLFHTSKQHPSPSDPPTVHPTVHPTVQPYIRSTVHPKPSSLINASCASTVLVLSNTGLQQIGDRFIRSEDVTKLYLENNGIVHVSDGAFEALPRLTSLSLSGNAIPLDQFFAFKSHSTLRNLEIDNNTASDYQERLARADSTMHRLERLSLKRNGIAEVDISLKHLAPRLRILDLSGNKIASLGFMVQAPPTLVKLSVDDNAIESVTTGLLDDLETLSISGNRISGVCNENCDSGGLSLEGLTKLKWLNASRNGIQRLSEDAFDDTVQLMVLDLSRNEIATLHEDAFGALTELRELRLRYNKLTAVSGLLSAPLLSHLDLSDNMIPQTQLKGLCRLASLETLLLANNQLGHVDYALFTVPCLQRLRFLDLSGNGITEIPRELISKADSLRVLLLRNNSIESLQPLYSERSNVLEELHLEDNPLPTLRIHHMPRLTVYLKDATDWISSRETFSREPPGGIV